MFYMYISTFLMNKDEYIKQGVRTILAKDDILPFCHLLSFDTMICLSRPQ